MKLRILISGICVMAAACEAQEPTGSNPNPADTVRALTVQERQVATASNRFAFDLLREVNTAEQAKPNFMISPLSASLALGMTLNGAAGTTFDAMRSTLAFGTLSQAEVNAAYRGLIGQLRARDQKVEWGLANSIWYDNGFAVFPTFTDTVRHYFDAEVRQLDFASASAPQTISNWAEQKTGGRIKNLITQIDPAEVMFLVNAVYFKAPWTTPFEPAATSPQPFTRLDGSTITVPMMVKDGSFRYVSNAQVVAVEMLYADSAYSMVVWQAPQGTSLAGAIAMLDEAKWNAMLAGMTAGRIFLRLPKFKFDYEIELKNTLSSLGMGIAFQPHLADFTRIADVRPENIYLTRVKQKSFIDVHELGTEAAAATAVGVGVTSMPPEVTFNRPFMFAIRERSTGTILFAGRITAPGL